MSFSTVHGLSINVENNTQKLKRNHVIDNDIISAHSEIGYDFPSTYKHKMLIRLFKDWLQIKWNLQSNSIAIVFFTQHKF